VEGSRLVAKKSKLEFEPITEILSPETAFVQTSNILDIAAQIATERQDVENLINIAAVYGELASRMMSPRIEEDDEEEEYDESGKQPIGFSPPQIIEPEEVSEIDGDSEDA
jgi:hypothetical protein